MEATAGGGAVSDQRVVFSDGFALSVGVVVVLVHTVLEGWIKKVVIPLCQIREAAAQSAPAFQKQVS